MPSVLDQLNAAVQLRRQQQEREASPSSATDTASLAHQVPDEAIDPALRGESTNGQRRQRSNSTDHDSARLKAKHARLTEDTCNAYDLRSTQRLEVHDFSGLDTHAKLIVVFGKLQSINRDLAMRDCKGFEILNDGKEQTHDMLRILLLAPTNKSYVTGSDIKKFLKRDISLHWDTWRITFATVRDPDALKELLKHLLSHLTSIRNEYKDTLGKARREGWCINQLMNALAPDSMYVTEKHRQRWVWILDYYKDYCTLHARENNFWHDLDKVLGEMEAGLAHQAPDLAPRAALRETIFEQALVGYRNTHPTQATARDTPYDAPGWQVALETRLARNHSFTCGV